MGSSYARTSVLAEQRKVQGEKYSDFDKSLEKNLTLTPLSPTFFFNHCDLHYEGKTLFQLYSFIQLLKDVASP